MYEATIAAVPTLPPVIVNTNNPPADTTDFVAWAGFILSLLLGLFEIWKYWNDKPRLKISARYNQEIMAMDEYGQFTNQATGKTFWTLDIANTGTKNIIITAVSFGRTDTKKMSLLTKDYTGYTKRYTLIPGDNHTYTIADELLNPKKVNQVQIFDATGKVYKRKLKYS